MKRRLPAHGLYAITSDHEQFSPALLASADAALRAGAAIIQYRRKNLSPASAQREAAASKMGFSAYGVTQNDDPVSQAMRGLIDNASSQEHQIALLWKAIEALSTAQAKPDCVPEDAARQEHFEAARINQLLD